MRHFFMGLLMMGLTMGAANAAPSKKIKTDDLTNLIIEGQNRLRVKESAPDPNWEPNLYKDFQSALVDESLLLSYRPPAVSEPPLSFSPKLGLGKTATPWFDTISESPVLSLKVKSPPTAVKLEWLFLVKDSQGREIYRQKKKGPMPAEITWKGFDSSGKPLQVGFDHSYSLSIIDEAGNPKHHAGEPFRMNSFRYQQGGKTVTSFWPELIFRSASEAKFSKAGLEKLTEVKDWLRPTYAKKIEIVTYDDDPKFGLSRSKAMQEFFVKELNWAMEKITARVEPIQAGQGYRHVDIVTK